MPNIAESFFALARQRETSSARRPAFDQNGRKVGLKRSSIDQSGEPAPDIVNGRAERTSCQPTANGGLQERSVGALEFFLLDRIIKWS